MAMAAQDVQTLMEKIQSLPAERIAEIWIKILSQSSSLRTIFLTARTWPSIRESRSITGF